MSYWFTWRGIDSDDMGVVVLSLPPMPRAERNATSIAIPGRDGVLTMSDDTYNDVSLKIKCGIEKTDNLRGVSAWLSGSGNLILSSDPERAYKAKLNGGYEFETFSWNSRTFELPFTAPPFAYEATPEIVELTASSRIYNPGTRWSLPIINVYGGGTLTMGDYEIMVEATSGEDYVTINSEIEECYFGDSNRNSKVSGISSGFPRLDPGAVDVTIGVGITKVEIQGNWRWF